MKISVSCSLSILLALSSVGTEALAQSQELKRPPRFDDRLYDELFVGFGAGIPQLQSEWSVTLDGRLTYGVQRARITRKGVAEVGSDVYVEVKPGQSPVNITNGASDNSAWRNASWSPDGSKLLMQGTRGGYRTLWVWDRATQKLEQLSKRGVASGGDYYEWLDDRRVLCKVLPEGKLPVDADQFWGWVPREMNPLLEGWKKTFEDKLGDEHIGKQSAASVLEAGIQQAPPDELRQLLLIDTVTKATTLVMDTYRPAISLSGNLLLVSPGDEYVAFYRYAPEDPGKFYGERMGLEIRRLNGKPLVLDKPLPETYVQSQTVRWSVDGTELMYFTYTGTRGDAKEDHASPKLMVVDLKQGKIQERSLGKLDARSSPGPGGAPNLIRAEWTEKGDIVVLVLRPEFESLQGMDRNYGDARPINEGDWWLIPRTGEAPRVLTAGMKTVANFSRRSRQGPLIGYADGELWRIDADAKLTNLTANFAPKLDLTWRAIPWPASENERFRQGASPKFIVPKEERPRNAMAIVSVPQAITLPDGTDTRRYTYYRVDTHTGAIKEIPKPDPEAILATMDPEAQYAFYEVKTNADKRAIWRVPLAEGKPELMFTLNAWRETVQVADTGEFFDYVDSLTGKPLKGIFYLPQMYEKGKQYPLIVEVYLRDISKRGLPKEPFEFEERTAGFAVMTPSVLVNQDGSRDEFMDIAGGILPAVDKVIEMGIADPDKLFIEGQSHGGFFTFAMVTQTTRFKAAFSQVGPSNFMSGWGTFSVAGRYREDASRLKIGWLGEVMGVRPANHNPWKDQAYYLKNSPISYVDRVRTPILINSNDMDGNVPMSQSDEFFAALYRMNKRARYVRYWGEGHGVSRSHANKRDLLQQKLSWYDEFGDVSRDALGNVIWEGKRVKGRGGKPALKPEDYLKFDLFGKGGPQAGLKETAPKMQR